ncbi:MAG: PTS sugar transporter subunit IIA [Bacillota bacterium]
MDYKRAAKKIIEKVAEEKLENKEEILAPLEGKEVRLEEVPDQVFAEKVMGYGIAIEPTTEKVLSPVKGEVIHLLETNHAVGLRTETGVEILIHIGIDTIKMAGQGFKSLVEEEDTVEIGDELLEFDLDLVKQEAKSSLTPVVITNTEEFGMISRLQEGTINIGDKILEVKF